MTDQQIEQAVGIDPAKYIVLGQGTDRVEHAEDGETYVMNYEPLEPGTYFVLRHRDLASINALRGYAQGLLLLRDVMHDPTTGDPMTPEQYAHLDELCHDVSALADQWEQAGNRKLPD